MASRGPRGTLAQTELHRIAATVEEDLRGRAVVRADRNMVAGVVGSKGNVAGQGRPRVYKYKYRLEVARFDQAGAPALSPGIRDKSPQSTPVRYFTRRRRRGTDMAGAWPRVQVATDCLHLRQVLVVEVDDIDR